MLSWCGRRAATPPSSNSSTTSSTHWTASGPGCSKMSRNCRAHGSSTVSSRPCSRRSARRGKTPPAQPSSAISSRRRKHPDWSHASSNATRWSAALRSRRGPERVADEMIQTELAFLTIAQAAPLIERKQLSPVELTTALIRRAEALDPQINAYLLLTSERALDRAREAEREIMVGGYRGPMHGIPFALKDIYSTAGIRTTGHSRVCLNTVPSADATTVRKLYEAGAVLTGKLATHEFARGGGVGPGGARLRPGRLDPRPRRAVRHRRAKANLRSGEPLWRLRELVQLRPCRPDDLDG